MHSILIASLAVISTAIAQTPQIETEFKWTGHPVDGFNPKTMAPLGDYTFIGCYIDSPGAVDNIFGMPQQQGVGMVFECIQQCAKQNFALAGVEDGSLCFCGNSFKKAQKVVPSAECSTPCQYMPWRACGGNLRLQVYAHTGLVQVGLGRIAGK